MEHYWHLGRWRGIPVSLHWTVLLAFPWLYLSLRSVLAALLGTLMVVALQLAHEAGHVAVARWRGLGVDSITLYGWHGRTETGMARKRWEDVVMGWSGVAVQLVILALAVLALPALDAGGTLGWLVIDPAYVVFVPWNVFLILVALLPIGPMDGHQAWQVVDLARQRLRRGKRKPKLTPQRERELQASSQRIADDIIRNLGKDKAGKR